MRLCAVGATVGSPRVARAHLALAALLLSAPCLALHCSPHAQLPASVAGHGGEGGTKAQNPSTTAVPARGVNLGNALDAPAEGDWGPVLSAEHFRLVAALGADHVRLPVRFDTHMMAVPPYTIEESFLQRVDWALAQAEHYGLELILDWHHYEALKEAPEQEKVRFLAGWRQLAERYQHRDESLLFELLNEPYDPLDAQTWGQLSAEAIRQIRKTNPTRRLVLDSPSWSNAPEFSKLIVPDDPQLILSFHMYEPHLFTVQGSPWMDPEYGTTGVVFPGPPSSPLTPVPAASAVPWAASWFARYSSEPEGQNPCAPAALETYFQDAKSFAAKSGHPVYVGEFAVVDWADEESRVRWLRVVRELAEAYGFGWAVWDDGGHNLLLDVQNASYRETLRQALFPTP